jgi:hypothetical protein
MSQQIFAQDSETVQRQAMNVAENWKLYDTVLIGTYKSSMDFNTGWFTTFLAMGLANVIPFFNVRNRTHGLPYNNQDVRDQLPYVFEIYSIGVTFFAPSTVTYYSVAPILAPQTTSNHLWEIELPKHASLTLKTNQDERLLINTLMTPAGYGPVTGGVGQGDPEVAWTYPNVSQGSFTQGTPMFTNTWGFPKPLKIPRTANLSVEIRFSEYARQLLQAMPGPYYQPMQYVANDGSFIAASGCAGIQVALQGKRSVQQRAQYHA